MRRSLPQFFPRRKQARAAVIRSEQKQKWRTRNEAEVFTHGTHIYIAFCGWVNSIVLCSCLSPQQSTQHYCGCYRCRYLVWQLVLCCGMGFGVENRFILFIFITRTVYLCYADVQFFQVIPEPSSMANRAAFDYTKRVDAFKVCFDSLDDTS